MQEERCNSSKMCQEIPNADQLPFVRPNCVECGREPEIYMYRKRGTPPIMFRAHEPLYCKWCWDYEFGENGKFYKRIGMTKEQWECNEWGPEEEWDDELNQC